VIALLLAILYPQRVRAVVADSCVESLPPAALLRSVSQRDPCDPGAARFWEQGHGADWREVVAADSDMLTRFAQGGGDWFHGRLNGVLCPTLLTLSLADELLVDAGDNACRMIAQMPHSRALLFPVGRHPLMWSRADEFHRAAADFMREV
jgi:pimeloyl-ACP methyl ester carboxylesterase